MIQDNHLAATI